MTPLIECQMAHCSVRAYSDQPIAPETLEMLLRAGQAASSSNFIQAYSIIRVQDPQTRKLIAEAAGGQAWVEQAAEFLVFCADLRRVDRACRQRLDEPLAGYAEHGVAALVDTALVGQNMLLAAESVGLGGVFIGGLRNQIGRVAEALEIPSLVLPLFGLCLGWPAERAQPKPRMPLSMILHQERYRDTSDQELDAYDEALGRYYRSRFANPKNTDWSAATATAAQGKKRSHMLDFLRRQGFFRC